MIKYLIPLCLLAMSLQAKDVMHVVKKGDYLQKIARKYIAQTEFLYLDDFIQQIKKENQIKKYVKPRQKLKIKLLNTPLKTKRIAKPKKVKALYYPVSNVAYKDFLKRVKTYKKVGINAVVIDIKNMTGEITIPFHNALKKEIKKVPWSSLGQFYKLLHYLHKEDIYVIARVVCFHDEMLAKHKKAYRVFRKNEEWVNPEHKDVQQYLLSLIDTLLKYPIDELQLDYVRYPASNSKQPKRADVIRGFLKKVHAKTQKAGIDLGLDVFGIALWQRKDDEYRIGQNLRKMADYADVISAMVYPSHFKGPFDGIKDPGNSPDEMIRKTTEREAIIFKGKKVEVRPYLQAFAYGTSAYNKDYILKQLKAIGDNGFIFWNARGKYQEVYDALHFLMLKEKKEALKEGKKTLNHILENIEN